MENNVAGVVEGLPSPLNIKVHVRMCSELLNLVVSASNIIPEIEATRPRASGIEVLCMLNDGISKAKSILRRCSESSILYLVLTGEAILSRCKNLKNLLELGLGQIQNMVPLMLAAKISGIISSLRNAVFHLDPPAEEASKILRELLHKYSSTVDSRGEFVISAIRTICSHLQISSRRALVLEKRSIRKMFDKLGKSEQNKRKILFFFVTILNKYRNIIITEQKDIDVSAEEHEDYPLPFASTHGREKSSTDSIASLTSYMDDLNLPLDFSSLSVGSDQGEFVALPMDSSSNAVEEVKRLLNITDEFWSMMPFGKLIEMLLRFLKDARNLRDVEAQITGCRYLLELLLKHRNSVSYLKDDAYSLLASFLDTEVAKQALSIVEVLSFHPKCGSKLAASGAPIRILNILNSPDQEQLERALNILINLSTARDISLFVAPSELIPKFIPLFGNTTLARYCIAILKNLCDNGDTGLPIIAETDGRIMICSIAKLLENGGRDEQEHAVFVLLSLCSQQARHRRVAIDEEVIPGLVDICVNGSKKAKAMAMKLMLILNDELSS